MAESKPKGNPHWVKGGPSPNPTGRPKGLAALVREIEDFDDLVRTVVRIRQGKPIHVGTADQARPALIPTLRDVEWACDWLADRGYGRPTQQVQMDVKTSEASDDSALGAAELAELQRLLESERDRGDDDGGVPVH